MDTTHPHDGISSPSPKGPTHLATLSRACRELGKLRAKVRDDLQEAEKAVQESREEVEELREILAEAEARREERESQLAKVEGQLSASRTKVEKARDIIVESAQDRKVATENLDLNIKAMVSDAEEEEAERMASSAPKPIVSATKTGANDKAQEPSSQSSEGGGIPIIDDYDQDAAEAERQKELEAHKALRGGPPL